jgi:hypothetical protein
MRSESDWRKILVTFLGKVTERIWASKMVAKIYSFYAWIPAYAGMTIANWDDKR